MDVQPAGEGSAPGSESFHLLSTDTPQYPHSRIRPFWPFVQHTTLIGENIGQNLSQVKGKRANKIMACTDIK